MSAVSIKPILRCALYLRKACGEADDASFDTYRLADDFSYDCYRYFGAAVDVVIYHDTSSSGMHTERPALQRLLQDVQARRIDVVAYPDLFHLSRNSADEATLTRYFASHGVPAIDGSVFMGKLCR